MLEHKKLLFPLSKLPYDTLVFDTVLSALLRLYVEGCPVYLPV